MDILIIILVTVHIFFAALWIGGALFIEIIMNPKIRSIPQASIISEAAGNRYTIIAWTSLSALTCTGLLMTYLNGGLSFIFLLTSIEGQLLLASIILTLAAIVNGMIITVLTRRLKSHNLPVAERARLWLPRIVPINLIIGSVVLVSMILFSELVR